MASSTPLALTIAAPRASRPVEIPLTETQVRGPSRFLDLPREVRNLIYEFALVEPPRWRRRHNAFCKYCPVSTSVVQMPPFDLHYTRRQKGGIIVWGALCPCSRRLGLPLLLCNRTIYEEASPYLWSKNILTAEDDESLIYGVRKVLCDETLAMIRHLAVFGDQELSTAECAYDSFWDCLFTCKNLRTLQIQHGYLPHHGHRIQRIPYQLPHLQSITMTALEDWRYSMASARVGGYNTADLMYTQPTLWIKIQQPVPMKPLFEIEHEATFDKKLTEIVARFRTNYCVHVKIALWEQLRLPSATIDHGDWTSSANYPLRIAMDLAAFGVPALLLRDGQRCRVEMLGLPLSKQARDAHHRRRQFNDALKAQGREEVHEKRGSDAFEAAKTPVLNKHQKKRNKRAEKKAEAAKKAQLAASQKRNPTAEPEPMTLEERQRRNAQRREDEESEIAEAKAARRAKLARDVREQSEFKKTQRKRAGRV